MDMNFEQMVRERAYAIWMSAGMADGKAHEHWVIAEQAVVNEIGEPFKAKATSTRTSPTKASPPAPKTAAPAKKTAAKKTAAKTSTTKPRASKAAKAKH